MIAVYAGSFDPITHGHQDLIERAARVFDKVIVGIGTNSAKKGLFLPGERESLMKEVFKSLQAPLQDKVEVRIFTGLLVNFCREVKAQIIVRGLRAVTDFEMELGIAHANAQLAPDLDTFFLVTTPQNSFVSSSVVKEIAKYGGDVSYYVHPAVREALRHKFGFSS